MIQPSPTPTETKTATPAPQEPAQVSNGTTTAANGTATITASESTSIQTEQTEPGQDTFTSIDVKSLTPELKSKYDAMLTDYKKKTTEAAQTRKEAEEIRKQVQEVIQRPEFQQAYNTMTTKEQAQAKEELGITDEEFNKAFESKDNFAGFVQKVARVSTAQSQREITDLKASLTVKDFKSAHPDYDQLNKYKFIEFQLRNDPRANGNDVNQWKAALKDAYDNSKRVYSELVEEGKKQGLERVQQKVNASTEPPTGNTPQVYPGGDPKKLTTREAIDLARRGIRVPQS